MSNYAPPPGGPQPPYPGQPGPGQPYYPPPAPAKRSGCMTAFIILLVLVGLCCILGAIGAAIMYPKFKKQMPQLMAMGELGAISESQSRFALNDLDKDGKKDYATSLEELDRADPQLDIASMEEASRQLGVPYTIEIVRADENGWAAIAKPPPGERRKSFYVDQTGVIRFRRTETGEAAGPDDPVLVGDAASMKGKQPSFSDIFGD